MGVTVQVPTALPNNILDYLRSSSFGHSFLGEAADREIVILLGVLSSQSALQLVLTGNGERTAAQVTNMLPNDLQYAFIEAFRAGTLTMAEIKASLSLTDAI